MKTFFDSSAFAKRYIEERGSEDVETLCQQASELALSVICIPEILSALNRRRRGKSITKAQYVKAKRYLLEDVHDVEIIQLTPSVVGTSANVLETHPVRAMDALHLACAFEWNAELFVSGDKKQLDAARRSGMKSKFV